MKYLLAAVAMVALLGFVGSVGAAPKEAKPKTAKGHFVKIEDNMLTYKGGAKGTGKDHTVKVGEKTKVTIDGKEAKLTDLKGDIYIEVTTTGDTATLIAAGTPTPPPAK